MRRFWNILSVLSLLILSAAVLSLKSQAEVALQDRLTQPIESANVTPMAGTVHPQAQPEFEQGLADNAKTLSMNISFQPTDAQEASLKALLQAQLDPASPSYHKWLTPVEFGQQFGMSSADIEKVSSWLQQQGFTVTAVAPSSNSISFSGSVAAAENAFHTEIHNYSVDGETHFANNTRISLPTALAGMVKGVRGLNNFRVKPRVQFAKRATLNGSPSFTSGISGSHYLAPGDFATIYDLNPLTGGAANSWGGTYTGKGVTIGVVGQTAIVLADITNFRGASGLPANNPTVVTVPGTTPETVAQGQAAGDLDETDLDLEWSGGVASGANVVLVNSDDVFTSLQYIIQNPVSGITVPIISESYGLCEAGVVTSDLNTIEGWLQQANAQGQTIVQAAGDTGAADCDSSSTQTITAASQGLAVDYPGSSAYVTDLGGTEFMGDGTAASPQTGSGTYWNAANGSTDTVTSVKSYIPEMVWNDTTYSIGIGSGLSAGGGGVSKLFSKPSWQTGVPGIPADGFRDVPDIALAASADHDGYLYCTQIAPTSNTNSLVSGCTATSFHLSDPGQQDNGDLSVAGGTSFATPAFAGILAVVEQKLATGGGLGNINPSLYTLAANTATYASAFHDVTTGNNQVPCVTGSPNCPTSGTKVIGYTAGTGYDQATGLGSLDANNFATAFAALVATVGTKTTLTASPANTVSINANVTFTATVTPNTLSTTPTGTVTFTIDGVAQTPVALSTASPYIATLTHAFPSAGTHTIAATFSSGNSTYTGSSSSSVTVTVAAQGLSATTTTVTVNPTTVALGSNLVLTATVTGATSANLTGPVTFTTGGITIGKVNQVTLSSSTSATAVLTVATAASLGFTAGTDTITAAYGGDTINATSSGTTTVTVTNPGITVTATNVSISSPNPGNSGTSTITLTSTGGYSGTAVVSASSSSLNADAGFGSTGAQTASVALASGGTGTTTLTITTATASGNVQKGLGANLRKAAAGATALGCIFLLLVPGIRRKRWPAALVMLVFLSVGAGFGCGGGGSGGAAPAGTYQVTISAQDSSNAKITGSTTLTVTIQ